MYRTPIIDDGPRAVYSISAAIAEQRGDSRKRATTGGSSSPLHAAILVIFSRSGPTIFPCRLEKLGKHRAILAANG